MVVLLGGGSKTQTVQKVKSSARPTCGQSGTLVEKTDSGSSKTSGYGLLSEEWSPLIRWNGGSLVERH